MVAFKNSALNVLAIGAIGVAASSGNMAGGGNNGNGVGNGATTTTSSYATSATGTLQKNGCYYSVPNVGLFTTEFTMSASSIATNGFNTVQDLVSSVYTVAAGNSPLSRRFDVTNIGLYNKGSEQAITLTVPGGQTGGIVSSSQLTTGYSDILYGSVRTVAKISSVAGTTHGFSFYSNDTQEIDFAFLTSDTSVAHLTNEQTSSSSSPTTYTVKAPTDATTAYHEYRVDWLPGKALFYIDSALVQTITGNVPTTAGFWLWNNWSNGNAWAAGPPKSDSVLYIKSIDGYFNRTSTLTSYASTKNSCNV